MELHFLCLSGVAPCLFFQDAVGSSVLLLVRVKLRNASRID